jgi:hypothetical protein
MARTTIRKVNEALQAAGFEGVELVKGNGYWYFSGGDAMGWYSSSVMVYHLNALTVEQWVAEARQLKGLR